MEGRQFLQSLSYGAASTIDYLFQINFLCHSLKKHHYSTDKLNLNKVKIQTVDEFSVKGV